MTYRPDYVEKRILQALQGASRRKYLPEAGMRSIQIQAVLASKKYSHSSRVLRRALGNLITRGLLTLDNNTQKYSITPLGESSLLREK